LSKLGPKSWKGEILLLTPVVYDSTSRITKFFLIFLLFTLIPISILTTSKPAEAVTTYCGKRIDEGTTNGISWKNYIDVYTNPACSGSRKVAYDFYANTWVGGQLYAVDLIYVDFWRLWFCGAGPDGFEELPSYNVWSVNWWPGWLTDNTCGFQADSHVHFYDAGVLDKWSYVNW
jgi:hypothetical protein